MVLSEVVASGASGIDRVMVDCGVIVGIDPPFC
jgi:hypothetical protein